VIRDGEKKGHHMMHKTAAIANGQKKKKRKIAKINE
jgi:hypothetical protein